MSHGLLKCMVLDDEEPARNLLVNYIEKVPGLEIAVCCDSALDALKKLDDCEIDLAFLDIQMPDLTGVEFLNLVKERIPAVVFTTAYGEYALKGYELGVIDYLVKPFSLERFIKAVDKAKALVKLKKGTNSQVQHAITTEQKDQSFFVKSGQKIIKIEPSELLYIEGMKEYVALNMASGKKVLTYQRMKAMEELLPQKEFIRIHRSFIVNKNFLAEIDGQQIKVGDKWLPVGGNYKEVLDGFLDRLV